MLSDSQLSSFLFGNLSRLSIELWIVDKQIVTPVALYTGYRAKAFLLHAALSPVATLD